MTTDSDKPNDARVYPIENYHEAAQLVAEHERLHTEHKESIEVVAEGVSLWVDPGVFRPDLSMMGKQLARALNIQEGETVLDIGTGTGFQAILAIQFGARSVVATDKQPEAVVCARKNIELHGLSDSVEVRESDLFSAVLPSEKFDVILSNFPFPPFQPKSDWQRANFDPGHHQLVKFLSEAKGYLSITGRMGMCWTDIGDTKYFNELIAKNKYSAQVVVEKKKGEIGAYIFELRPQ